MSSEAPAHPGGPIDRPGPAGRLRHPRRLLAALLVALALLLPGLALAAPPPPDLVAPVSGEVRIRVKRGSAGADHRIFLLVDRGGDGRWDETYSLPRLVGENSSYDTGVDVAPGDELDLRLDVSFNGYSNRILYTRDRRSRAGEPEPRVIAPTGRRCGGGAGSPPLDISDLMTTSANLIACSCWEDYTDWDFNDFALCVDYTPDSLPSPTPTLSVTATITPTATLTPTLSPTPSPTPSASPSPVRSATPSPSPSATPSPSPSASPTSRPAPVYLPFLLHQRCNRERLPADLALLIDVSTSMLEPGPEGQRPLDAALVAARDFADLLDLAGPTGGGRDRLAIVGFNRVAWTALPLSEDRRAIAAALGGLAQRGDQGTRMDLAFAAGLAALRSEPGADPRPGPLSAQRAIILLTDGQPNQVPTPMGGGGQEETVLAAAAEAKAAGLRVFTIGLGDPEALPRWLLERAASSPGDFRQTPDGAGLAAIYAAIAREVLRCP